MFIAHISVSLRIPGLKVKSPVVIMRLVGIGGLVKIYTMVKLVFMGRCVTMLLWGWGPWGFCAVSLKIFVCSRLDRKG